MQYSFTNFFPFPISMFMTDSFSPLKFQETVHGKGFSIFLISPGLEVKLELRWGTLVLFVLVVKLPSLFSITVIVCTLPPGAIHDLESASGIPISLCSADQFGSLAWVVSSCRHRQRHPSSE